MGRLKLCYVLVHCRLVTAESQAGKLELQEGVESAPIAARFSFPVSFPTHHLVILIFFP